MMLESILVEDLLRIYCIICLPNFPLPCLLGPYFYTVHPIPVVLLRWIVQVLPSVHGLHQGCALSLALTLLSSVAVF